MTYPLYFDDPLCLEFYAEVTDILVVESGKIAAILPRTYFYPTSGGQDHDTGKIGDAQVTDVYKDEEGRILHILDREIKPGEYPASIDKMRRFRNMQAHTAQHILSRAFDIFLNLDTLSAHINSDNPSTIDLNADQISLKDLNQVEEIANSILFENRKVKSYHISDSEISKIPFRRPPKVTGRIRVVEVDGYDYSACGGTHCPQTGMLGVIKIIRTEIQSHKLRVHFVAGYQALEIFQCTFDIVKSISGAMDAGYDQLPSAVQRQADLLYKKQLELESLRSRLISIEADRLLDSARRVGNLNLVTNIYQDKSPEEIRKLAATVRSKEGKVVILAFFENGKLSLVVGCSEDVGLDARKILNLHLGKFNGRGGGDRFLAQGGCALSVDDLEKIFCDTEKDLISMDLV
jgi:alanyl-tRNA synthetase